MPSLMPNDPTIHISSPPVPNPNLKGDEKIEITMEEVKSKIEVLKCQIKQIKEADERKCLLCDLCLYLHLEYPPKFQVPKLERYNRAGCPQTYLPLYGIAMS